MSSADLPDLVLALAFPTTATVAAATAPSDGPWQELQLGFEELHFIVSSDRSSLRNHVPLLVRQGHFLSFHSAHATVSQQSLKIAKVQMKAAHTTYAAHTAYTTNKQTQHLSYDVANPHPWTSFFYIFNNYPACSTACLELLLICIRMQCRCKLENSLANKEEVSKTKKLNWDDLNLFNLMQYLRGCCNNQIGCYHS